MLALVGVLAVRAMRAGTSLPDGEPLARPLDEGSLLTEGMCPGVAVPVASINVAENACRFDPMRVAPDDVSGFYGANERIAAENLAQAARVYVWVLQAVSSTPRAHV